MLAIVGATGKIGGAAARALRRHSLPVRAIVRYGAQAEPLKQIGCEVAVADLRDEDALTTAIQGMSAALVICPLNPRAEDAEAVHAAQIETLGRAVERARPGHIVAISDYGAHHADQPGLTTIFYQFEQRLRATGVPTTLIRSAEHMENWGRRLANAARTGTLTEVYGPPAHVLPLVSAFDVGQLAAEVLAGPPPQPGTARVIHVEGPRRYSMGELAETITELAGRSVERREVTRDDRMRTLLAGGMSESYGRLVFDLIDAQRAGRLDVEPGGEVRRGPTGLRPALAATQHTLNAAATPRQPPDPPIHPRRSETMTIPTQAEQAARFAKLHEAGCFILPNAWDVPSAALIAEAGFPAIATTSSGLACAQGFPDGERISRDRMLAVVADIARRVPVPVTADLEAGYGPEPADVAETVRRAIEAGVVGCNIEDGDPRTGKLFDFDLAVARIEAGVAAARAAGLPDFVLNARTDPYLRAFGTPEQNLAEAVRRANAFLQVGARCAFVPGPADPDTIGRLARAIDGPLNLLAISGGRLPPLAELRRLGVRRVSLAGSLMTATYTATRRTLAEVAATGSLDYTIGTMTGREMNALVAKYS